MKNNNISSIFYMFNINSGLGVRVRIAPEKKIW